MGYIVSEGNSPSLGRGYGNSLSLAKPKVLVDLSEGTFARSTEATVFNEANGVMKRYGVNILRPGVKLKYTIEGSSSNVILDRNDISGAAWLRVGVTITPNDANGPELAAGSIADLVSFDTNNRYFTQNILGLPDSTVYTQSIFARTVNNAGEVRIPYGRDKTPVNQFNTETVQPSRWQRFSQTFSTASGASDPRGCGIYSVLGDEDLWAVHAQFEQQPFPTTYMCDVTESRSWDDLSFTATNSLAAKINNKRWSIDYIPMYDDVDSPTLARILNIDGSNYINMGSTNWVLRRQATNVALVPSYSKGDHLRITCDFKNGEFRIDNLTTGDFWVDYGDSAVWPTNSGVQVGNSGANTAPIWGEISDIFEAEDAPLLNYADVTFTRATAAWNYDTRSTPKWYSFLSGEPRLLDDGSISVESQRTNYAVDYRYSEQPPWLLNDTATTTPGYADPAGGTDGTRIQLDNGTNDAVYDSLNRRTGDNVYSTFARKTLFGSSSDMQIRDPGATPNAVGFTLTTSWQRFVGKMNVASGGSGNVLYGDARATDALGAHDEDWVGFCPQLEQADFASEPILCNATVTTRNGDEPEFPFVPALMFEDAFTIPVWPGADSSDHLLSTHYLLWMSAGEYVAFTNLANGLRIRYGGTNNDFAITYSKNQRIDITIDNIENRVTIAGATTGNGTFALTGTGFTGTGVLRVGFSGGFQFDGVIGRPQKVATTATDYLLANSGTGTYTGVNLGTMLAPSTWGVVVRVGSFAFSPSYFLTFGQENGTTGFQLRVNASNQLVASVGNGSTRFESPIFDLSTIASDGDYHSLVGTFDGSTVRLFVDAVEVGTGTAFTGTYSPPSGADRLTFGFPSALAKIYSGRYLGAAFSKKVLTASEISSWQSDCKAAADVVEMPLEYATYSYKRSSQLPEKWHPISGVGPDLETVFTPTDGVHNLPTWAF